MDNRDMAQPNVHLHVDWKAVAGVVGTICNLVIQFAPIVNSQPGVTPAVIHDVGIAVQIASAGLLLLSKFNIAFGQQPVAAQSIASPPAPAPSTTPLVANLNEVK